MAVFVFVLALLGFVAIGLASARKKTDTTDDYLLADRNVPAWLAALSAVATNNSGFMFIGLIGFTYTHGVQAVWLQAGWLLGDLLTWLRLQRRLREESEALGASSLPALLGTRADGSRDRAVTVVAAAITLFFLVGYAAAQLEAGSAALHVLLGWDAWLGVALGAVIVVLYSFSGGLRASIWTDAAQSAVMLAAMVGLLAAAALRLPPSALADALRAEDPALLQWVPGDLRFGLALYVLGFVCAGLGVIGQPHILVRTMCLDDPRSVPRARAIYFAWFVPFSVSAVLVGLYARALLTELPPSAVGPAEELAMPLLATQLLPDALVGLSLAGLFAATISTADSQLLACSAALTQDLFPRFSRSYLASKLATLTVGAFALAVALGASRGVFALVLMAWSALGASLGPILILRLAHRPVRGATALAMMLGGLATVFLWSGLGLSGAVFELLPGFAVAFLIYGLAPLVVPRAPRPAEGSLDPRPPG